MYSHSLKLCRRL